MGCYRCHFTGYVLEYDKTCGPGYVEAPCLACNWPCKVLPPIPAPVDALAFLSDSKRIALGEDEAWREYDLDKADQVCYNRNAD